MKLKKMRVNSRTTCFSTVLYHCVYSTIQTTVSKRLSDASTARCHKKITVEVNELIPKHCKANALYAPQSPVL